MCVCECVHVTSWRSHCLTDRDKICIWLSLSWWWLMNFRNGDIYFYCGKPFTGAIFFYSSNIYFSNFSSSFYLILISVNFYFCRTTKYYRSKIVALWSAGCAATRSWINKEYLGSEDVLRLITNRLNARNIFKHRWQEWNMHDNKQYSFLSEHEWAYGLN